jgi:hypothetical protein
VKARVGARLPSASPCDRRQAEKLAILRAALEPTGRSVRCVRVADVPSFESSRFAETRGDEILATPDGVSERWKVSYWDAAIVEAARAAGCPVLLSEDLQHGMDFAGVRVVDPFR